MHVKQFEVSFWHILFELHFASFQFKYFFLYEAFIVLYLVFYWIRYIVGKKSVCKLVLFHIIRFLVGTGGCYILFEVFDECALNSFNNPWMWGKKLNCNCNRECNKRNRLMKERIVFSIRKSSTKGGLTRVCSLLTK